MFRAQPLVAGGLAVAIALTVAGIWMTSGRSRAPDPKPALEGTVAVRITRHDPLGMPVRTSAVRDRARVRAIVEALGVDEHPALACPPDYAAAELGLVLSGQDAYARRNVYVWGLFRERDTGIDVAAHVVVVTSSGCRGGPAPDTAALRREMLAIDAGP